MVPAKLERQFADLVAKGADASYTDYRRGRVLAEAGPPMLEGAAEPCEGAIFAALLRRNFLLTSSIVVKREILARCGIFKSALKGGQDIDLWLRVARIAHFARLREPLTFYRQHGGNITASPKYSYYHARRWEAVYHEHADLDAAEREYIRGRWVNALFVAGRKAWWRDDFSLARQCFHEMRLAGDRSLRCSLWRTILLLPDAVLKRARLGKKRLVEDDDDRPGAASTAPAKIVPPTQ